MFYEKYKYFYSSAKHLVKGEPNVAYICSRYYRAPELIFGATDYTTMIGKSISSLYFKIVFIQKISLMLFRTNVIVLKKMLFKLLYFTAHLHLLLNFAAKNEK